LGGRSGFDLALSVPQRQRSRFLLALLLFCPNCSSKFFVGHCGSSSLAANLDRSHLRNLRFRGMIVLVTMRRLALGLQAALFIDSRLFIPMLHILLLRTL
jgi:hypothetical protein